MLQTPQKASRETQIKTQIIAFQHYNYWLVHSVVDKSKYPSYMILHHLFPVFILTSTNILFKRHVSIFLPVYSLQVLGVATKSTI